MIKNFKNAGFHSIGNSQDVKMFEKVINGQKLFENTIKCNAKNMKDLSEKLFKDVLSNKDKLKTLNL